MSFHFLIYFFIFPLLAFSWERVLKRQNYDITCYKIFIFFYFLKDYYNYTQLNGSVPLFHFNIFAFLYLFPDIFCSLFIFFVLPLYSIWGMHFFSFILLNVLLEQVWVFCLFSTFSSPGRFLVSSKISLPFASFFDSWHGIILAFHVIPFTKYSFNRIMQKAWSNANQVCMLVGFIIDGTA